MPFNARFSTMLLAAVFATGCYDAGTEAPAASKTVDPASQSPATPEEKATLYPLIAEVLSGTGKVAFYDAGEGRVLTTEVKDAGSAGLIDPSMEGLTYAEIHARLAPGRPVPEALKRATQAFSLARPGVTGDASALNGGADGSSAPLAKTAGQWDVWFQQNYCQGVNQCLLNRTGGATDWMQSTNRYSSIFYVMVYQGSQITAKLKIDGSTKATQTVLYGQVMHFWGTSGYSFWCGGTCSETHRLEISDGTGDGWHMSGWYAS